jgi:predicted nucleic acid-binding Zn ribbon protein
MAATTFKGVQKLVEHGDNIVAVGKRLSVWYQIAFDISQAERESKNPSLLKKATNLSKSRSQVNAESLNWLIAKKEIQKQNQEIRTLVTSHYGIDAYRDMIAMRKTLVAARDKEIYEQKRRRRKISDLIAVLILISAAIVVIVITSHVIHRLSNPA